MQHCYRNVEKIQTKLQYFGENRRHFYKTFDFFIVKQKNYNDYEESSRVKVK